LQHECGKKILIVDDKAAGRELVKAALERGGYRTFEAGDGIDALRVARDIHPDLILLDLYMPVLDGFGLMKELRCDEKFRGTPIVAFTASAMEGDRRRAMEAGFAGYITKPISLSALRDEVERLLR
jgi:CheY-like chemotaxis protein